MENASKALIIAGAILLAILIISLGIMIYNQASGVVNNNAVGEVDISTFNNKFTQYEGDRVRGAQVNALLQQIQSNNITYKADGNSRQVSVKVDNNASWQSGPKPDGAIDGSTAYVKANTGSVYKVTIDTNGTTGLVDKVTIENAT